jgi:hypothetical protein
VVYVIDYQIIMKLFFSEKLEIFIKPCLYMLLNPI